MHQPYTSKLIGQRKHTKQDKPDNRLQDRQLKDYIDHEGLSYIQRHAAAEEAARVNEIKKQWGR